MDITDLKKATRLRHILMIFACLLLFYGLIPVYSLGLDRRDFIIASILFFCGSIAFWGGASIYDDYMAWRTYSGKSKLELAIVAFIVALIFIVVSFYYFLISV